jgi:hypothetical protein
MSECTTRRVGLYAVVAAGAAAVVSPLLALAYSATGDGLDEVHKSTVSAWEVPARSLAGGLLTWAGPDRVYGTYWLLFWVLFAAMFLCARAAHARRPAEVGRLERWGWRMVLVGYGLGAVGSLAALAIVIGGTADNVVIDVAFFALMLPALAIDAIGSTLLGIALVRAGYEPKITAWLLVLVLPVFLVVPEVLGNFSFGLLPIFAAWAATGWRLWRVSAAERPETAAAAAQ